MLAYLALSPHGRFQRRDRLVGLLWPELDQEHARAALRKALHVVRSSLGDAVVVTRGDEEVAIAPGELWCDAAAFTQQCDEGTLESALDLYEGELMPGFHLPDCGEFDAWLEERRGGLRERAVAVVLSGSGSDGAMGVKAVKKMGGTVIVQEGSEFSGMPDAALRTGAVDFVLPLAEIAPALFTLVTSNNRT